VRTSTSQSQVVIAKFKIEFVFVLNLKTRFSGGSFLSVYS
jgi:hypothetical protein